MGLVDLIFPKTCLGCGKSGRYLCKLCLRRKIFLRQVCPMCLSPSIDGITHIKCKAPYGMDGLFVCFTYEGVVKKAIKTIKYKFVSDLKNELADLISLSLKKRVNSLPKKGVLVPIPIYKKRENWRGFNHVEEIAKALDFGHVNLVIKTKETKPQSSLMGKKRRKNLIGVFSLNKKFKLKLKKIRKNSAILFDDVFTTGSTMREACKVLKRNGFKSVWGLSIAR